jgi:hypothetical protein
MFRRKQLFVLCRVSAVKHPDFIVQGADDETPRLWGFLKMGKWFSSGVKSLLLTTGVLIPVDIFRLPHGLQLWCTNGAHVEVGNVSIPYFLECDKIRAFCCRHCGFK